MAVKKELSVNQTEENFPCTTASLDHTYFDFERTNYLFDSRITVIENLKKTEAPPDIIMFLEDQFSKLDRITIAHSIDVANLMWHFTSDFDQLERLQFYIAALLHDIGKQDKDIVPILCKPTALSPEERISINKHPQIGADIVRNEFGDISNNEWLQIIYDANLCHHLDITPGQGYPENYDRKNGIPKIGIYVKVLDCLSAATMDRGYNNKETLNDIYKIFPQKFKNHFDKQGNTKGPEFSQEVEQRFMNFLIPLVISFSKENPDLIMPRVN